MRYRSSAVPVVLALCLAMASSAAAQNYAPGRPSFTLADRIQQFIGGSNSQNKPAQSGTSRQGRRGYAGPNLVNRPNYHNGPGSYSAQRNRPMAEQPADESSSRRTAQDTYRSSPSELRPIPEAETQLERASIPAPEPPSFSDNAPQPSMRPSQPRTLAEALFNSRNPEPATSSSPALSHRRRSPPPTTSTAPRTAGTPTPAEPRVARSVTPEPEPEPAVEGPETFEPVLEPAPVARPAPVKRPPTTNGPSPETLLFTQKSPVLAVEATGPRRTAVGRKTRYKIAMRNTGDVPAKDVLLVVQLPSGVEVAAAHPTVGEARLPASREAAPVLRWSINEVPSRSQEDLELEIIPRTDQALELAVQWTYAPETQLIAVDVREPKLQMQLVGPKEVAYGEKAIYKLTFSNPGDADAENVVVMLPAVGGEGVADSHTLGTIRAGESKTVEMELVAKQTGRLTIKAEATGDAGLHASASEDVIVRRAGLKVELEGPKTQFARTNATYKVLVSNVGNAAATDVQVAAQLPPRAKFVSATQSGKSEGERISWTLPLLDAGQQQVLEFKCQLEDSGTNRVQAAAVFGDLRDLASLTTDVEAVADLALTVIEPAGVFAVGEDVTYEVHIKNRGTTSAEGVSVVAYFSEGIEATSATGSRYDITPGQIAFHPITSIAADKELILKIKARADQPGNHVFRAEVQCAATGAKLAKEGTTRFYKAESASSDENDGSFNR